MMRVKKIINSYSIVNFYVFRLRRKPASTLFPYTTPLPICIAERHGVGHRIVVRGILELGGVDPQPAGQRQVDRKSTRLNSSHMSSSYAVFCLKKKIHEE